MRFGVDRSNVAVRIVTVLLATTCLTPFFLAGGAGSALADGGTGNGSLSGGGGGGAGGYGAVVANPNQTFTTTGTVTGGNGGQGGTGATIGSGGSGGFGILNAAGGITMGNANGNTIRGGNGSIGFSGGAGGTGVSFTGTGNTFTNLGAVTGGDGGGAVGGTAGAGGVGITGSNLTVITSGGIAGGTGGGGAQANAITFTGGTNILELRSGFTISGNVDAVSGGNDTLRLGGSVDGSFNPGVIDSGFNNFANLEKTGSSTWTLTAASQSGLTWTVTGGTLAIASDQALGGGPSVTLNGGALQMTASGPLFHDIILGPNGGALNIDPGVQVPMAGDIIGSGGFTKAGAGILQFAGPMSYTGGTTVLAGTLTLLSGTTLDPSNPLTVNGGTFDLSQFDGTLTVAALGGTGGTIALGAGLTASSLITNSSANTTLATTITGDGSLTKQGSGILTMTGTSTYTGGTTVQGGLINFNAAANFGTGAITLNGGGLQWATGTSTDISGQLAPLGAGGGTLDTNGNNISLATAITGGGALTKQGQGILTFTTANTYTGGTTVTGGLINFNAANNFGTGQITLNGGGLQWATGNTLDISSRLTALGAGGGTFDTNGNNVSLATAITGAGSFTKQGLGTLNLTGTNTYTGPTSINAGTLAVNGSITSNVTVGTAGTLGGTGTIFGGVNTQGIIAPGNSIGTITVNGSFVQAAGSTYQVEVNAAGQGDRINVTGAPGTATINGGTVQVVAAAGSYANSTTYTILNATGGRTGTYSGVTSNFAFLTPTLTYDPNNVFLTLAIQPGGGGGGGGGFLMSAYTPNQKAVGTALNQSFASATGDYATVIGTLAGLNAFAGPGALTALSGEQYADFGTMNVNNAALFMNAVGQQMAVARGTTAATGQRAALAMACDVAACDGVSPFSVWGSALGGVGSVTGDTNASTTTYNFGGAAVGIDYRLDPRFLVGLSASYTSGNLWVNGFPGKGWTNNVGVVAYGSFTQDGFYADLLAGYGWYNNQLQRQITIPGLQRTANGSTNANQALGQVETGYRFGIYAPANATLAPFGRLQVSSVTQNGFSESGAQSLNLNVNQQTTNSLRTLFGLDLASVLPVSSDRTVDIGLRLGWQHEFAYTGRPITAALSGASFAAFTVYGATPQPDAAVVSFRAATSVATGTQLYLRYDGDIGSGTDNHALNLGMRLSF